jgi:porin
MRARFKVGLFSALAIFAQAAESPRTAIGTDYFADSSACCDCAAAAAPIPPPDFSGCLCCRPKLTGDWHGERSCWAEHGVTLDADVTQFYFGVAHGGLDTDSAYGGHGDYVFNFDMDKLAGHEGLFIKLRAEHRFGETINGKTGAFFPAEISPALPVPDSEDLYLTNVLFTQFLSESFGVFAGKLDTLDGDANAFAHGRGKEQFSNLAFTINPALLRTIPYSTLGAGLVVLREKQPIFTFMVLNATDTARTAGFDELFAEGAALVAEMRLPTNFFCLPGHQLFGGTWNSRDYVSLGQDPRIVLPDVPIARESGSWGLYWNFDQYLYVDPCTPTRGWGLFGRAGLADDESNPIDYFLSFGVGGNSTLRGREADRFGVGWYYSATSDEIGPILEAGLGPIGDGQGVELFYNYEVTPWFHLTPDLQVLIPARDDVDDALVLGLRGKMDF